MIVKIADLCFEIKSHYSHIENICKEYACCDEAPLFTIEITDADMQRERRISENNFSDEYFESTAVMRKFALKLADFNGCVFHGAVVVVNNRAVAFSAPSATGKTTHINLWQKLLGDKIFVLNGDKPVVRIIDEKPFVYGTPWAGKENLQKNTRAPLAAVCFLQRGKQNRIERLDFKYGANHMLNHMYCIESLKTLDNCINILENGFNNVEFYNQWSTPDIKSAVFSHYALWRTLYED